MEETWDFKKKEKNNVMSKSKQTVLLMSFAKVVWQLKQKKKKKIQYGAQHTKRQYFIDSYIKEWGIMYPMEVSLYMSKC